MIAPGSRKRLLMAVPRGVRAHREALALPRRFRKPRGR